MEIKETPLEEKYDKLLDNCVLTMIKGIAPNKEPGALDKSRDLAVKVQKKRCGVFLIPHSN